MYRSLDARKCVIIGNTDDVGDVQIDFLNGWTNICDENSQFSIKICVAEFNDAKLHFEYNIEMFLNGDLHMIWNAVGCLNNRSFMIVFFRFKCDATDNYHKMQMDGHNVWFHFISDPAIRLQQFLGAKQYSNDEFKTLLRSKRIGKNACGVTITPKAYIFHLYDILDETIKDLKTTYPDKPDKCYLDQMKKIAKQHNVPFYRRGIKIAVSKLLFCLVHFKNRTVGHLWSMALSHQHKYNGYRPISELSVIKSKFPALKSTINATWSGFSVSQAHIGT